MPGLHPFSPDRAVHQRPPGHGSHRQVVPGPRAGEPIASCAVYLASDESSYVTGSDILIDGGYTAM
ncbi:MULTISPECIES: SDR family oxidoreductase [Pseudomonadaceae]|uniref:SDR family oxidoreductase n=1 Tax=Pseudomonadaceae TaxID=135621 RepID=UPI0015559853|nr:SDR family oxidoreductase [Stutzerimonas nitrititolerans]